MLHLGRKRNSNEFCGAYGHGLTFDEMKWLADWCFVRGVNLLIPHAFYYSVRGLRRDERPPDVGPHSAWWDSFAPFADHCRTLSWVNTDSRHVCDVAVLTDPDACPWEAAKALYESQHDFNHVDASLLEPGMVKGDGLHIAGMHYRAVVVEPGLTVPACVQGCVAQLESGGRLVRWSGDPRELLDRVGREVNASLRVDPPQPALRCRHVVKEGWHFLLLFNEESRPITFSLGWSGHPLKRLDTYNRLECAAIGCDTLNLREHEMALLTAPDGMGCTV